MVYTVNFKFNFFNLRYTLLGIITHPYKTVLSHFEIEQTHLKLLVTNFNALYTSLGTIMHPLKLFSSHFEREQTPF